MLTNQVIFADWPAPANVHAVATTRQGGMSHRPYDSLNLGLNVGDEPRRVKQNRELLVSELNLPAAPVWLDQQHGRGVIALDGAGAKLPKRADAAVAHTSGKVCVVLTADCLPVLICDTDGTRIAAIHAGWRGLAAGVIEAAVATLNPRRRTLLAWLGPAIGPAAYEIDTTVQARLLAAAPSAGHAFAPTRPGHWQADLAAIAREQLHNMGVADIFGGGMCTYTDNARFFSHRREGRCGRQASLIWMDN